jgi:CheY-like chemotaxis protein
MFTFRLHHPRLLRLTEVVEPTGCIKHLQLLAKSRKVTLTINNYTQLGLQNLTDVEDPAKLMSSEAFAFMDKNLWNQVLRNIITNAIKFCPAGIGAVTVTISASTDVSEVRAAVSVPQAKLAGSVRFTIADNGAGIAAANVSKVFSEFSQFDKNKLQAGRGSGLGLWISRHIVQLHGGSLGFSSGGLGKGCVFYACLPVYEPHGRALCWLPPVSNKVVPVEDVTSYVSDVRTRKAEQDVDPRHLKILIVDDSSLNLKFNKLLIHSDPEVIKDPIVEEAEDGDVAVEAVRTSIAEGKPFDLVLIDSLMINMHGPEAVCAMRKQLGYKGLIIGVTGNALAEDILNFIDHGADHVITKPLKRQKLFELLKSEGLI